MKKNKRGSEWFNEKEATGTPFPYILTLWTLKHCPKWFTNFMAWCASGYYFIFDRRSRTEIIRYQKTLKKIMPELKFRPFRQLCSFAVTVIEKIDCWTNPIPFENIHFNGGDVHELIDRLNQKKGVFVFISHLGNFEVLRSLATAHKMGVQREVPFAILSDMDVSSNFSAALNSMSGEFTKNMVSDDSVTPATIEKFMDVIEDGGIVVCAGDRLSKNTAGKTLRENFLGQEAPFSYGAFLLAALLGAPVYYIFGFRKRDIILDRKFEMFVKKSQVNLAGGRKERDVRINNLCAEYAATLQDFCKQYPYQWYNFFDFWKFPEEAQNANQQ